MDLEEIRNQRNAYLLRGLVGALILYYAYSLFRNLADADGTKWYVLLVFAILFVIAAVVMLITGLAGFAKYAKMAAGTDDDGQQENENPKENEHPQESDGQQEKEDLQE